MIRLETRRVDVVGSTAHPNAAFMNQAALDITAFGDSVLRDVTHLIGDLDPRGQRRRHGEDSAAVAELTPHAERFVRSIKSECLSQMIIFGQRSLDRAICEFVEHDHAERNHQELGNRLLEDRQRPCP